MISDNEGKLKSTVDISGDRAKEVHSLLKKISDMFGNPSNLQERAKAFKEYGGGIPEAWPPPVLTDWLAVDLDAPGFHECVTRLKTLKGVEAGRDLPLIWLEPPMSNTTDDGKGS